MLDSGQTPAYIASVLGVSENLIYRWKSLNQAGKKVVVGQGELTFENQQLKDRVRQLETEREILKKCPAGVPVEHFQPGNLTLRYDLIQALSHEFPVETLCTVLGLSRTAYYRYQRGQSYRPTKEKQDKKQLVERIFQEHKRRYGSPGPPVRAYRGRTATGPPERSKDTGWGVSRYDH